jgi:hypothetical protein
MPVKLPAPDFGTEEQAGPKSAAAAAGADEAGIEDAGAEDAGADADEPLELHAVAVRAQAARPAAASTRYFMVSPLWWAAVR